jgi:two-component system phosphate regulon sensor histidine kinase PhoR
MKQNNSPQNLIIVISIIITGISVIATSFHDYIVLERFSVLKIFSLFLVTFIFTFITIRYFIKKYVSNKLKPIYSLVRKKPGQVQTKEDVKLNSDVFGDLNGEVANWVEDKNKEVQSIKDLEQYRKDYVGNISHELKTPLTSVQGYIHTLLEDVEDENIRIKFLRKAANNTERLIQIVNDLELITKIESGNNIIELSSFNILDLTNEILDDMSFMTVEKNISLNLIHGNLSSYQAYGDKEAIRKVLSNLVINSIKYGKEDGKSTIKFYDMVDNFLIEVIDNGLGIDEEHLPHLFDRFYRVDKSRNRNIGGSGLGLSIVKHIIESHNETVHVKSKKGEGSTFSFTLKKG